MKSEMSPPVLTVFLAAVFSDDTGADRSMFATHV